MPFYKLNYTLLTNEYVFLPDDKAYLTPIDGWRPEDVAVEANAWECSINNPTPVDEIPEDASVFDCRGRTIAISACEE